MAGELFGDYSRIPTVGPRVRSLYAQQGRVVLDSDVNAQTSLILRHLRTMIGDLVGPAAGPSGDLGFAVTAPTEDGRLVLRAHPGPGDLPGRYYVDGILCQIDAETTYFEQPDAFLDPEATEDELPDPPFLAYLKVWERTVTAVEDPSIREVALGSNGPDTTTRQHVVWQLLVTTDLFGQAPNLGSLSTAKVRTAWTAWAVQRDEGRATLRARASRPPGSDDEPCPTPPSAAYRGVENQLYRVEIHTVGEDADGNAVASFKWSRDNGSATYPIESLEGEVATLTTLGRDKGLMVDAGDWVEVVDDRYMLYPGAQASKGQPFGRTTAPLLRVMDVEPLDRTVRLSAAPDGVGQVAARHAFLRRWDQQPRPDGSKVVAPGNGLEVRFASGGKDIWIDLEDGVQVAFQPGMLRVGDYWLIPARTETGDVEWPGEAANPEPLPPMGIDYAFAPLAVVRPGNNIDDLRMEFAPTSKPA
jgi:hypothetical protein